MTLRLVGRRLLRAPAFTAAALITLALAIGGNTAVFSLFYAALLRPLPFDDPNHLVVLWEDHSRNGGEPRFSVAPATLEEFRRRPRSFTALEAQWGSLFNVAAGTGDPESLPGAQVSAGYFTLLGVRPLVGRGFQPGDDQPAASPVVVLSHALWQRRFGGDPGIVGRTLEVSDQVRTVVGVMPPEVRLPLFFRAPRETIELWVPLVVPPEADNHEVRILQVLGRLTPGASIEGARAEVETVARRLATERPESNAGVGATLVPLREQMAGDLRPVLLVLLGSMGFVLLIACANLGGLLLARALARGREMSLRAALGAGRARLASLVLAESLALAVAGGAAGLLLGAWLIRLLPRLLPEDALRLSGAGLDLPVLGFTAALVLLTGLAFGVPPALRAGRADLRNALQEGGKGGGMSAGRSRLGRLLVAAQIALTLLLLIGAGLMMASLSRLRAVDPGFDPARRLTFKLALPATRYAEPDRQVAFYRELERRLAALPGVRSVGSTNRLPLDPSFGAAPLIVQGKPVPAGERPQAGVRIVSPGYFRTLGIPLLAGRPLEERDREGTRPVLLVNQSLARRLFSDQPAVGRKVSFDGSQWIDIVGVVGDVAHDSLAAAPVPEVYLSYAQSPTGFLQIVVQTAAAPLSLVPAVRREIRALDSEQPVLDLKTLDQHAALSVARPRFSALLLAAFAAVGVVLAAVGVFGLTAWGVAQRTREIGIRMALGADRGQVLRAVVGQTLGLAGLGIAFGLAAGFLLTRWLRSQLFMVSNTDPLIFLGGALLLASVAALAAWLPARRAARLEPTMALRQD